MRSDSFSRTILISPNREYLQAMRRFRFTPVLILAVYLLHGVLHGAGKSASGSEGDRPNVIVILTDDQGWGDLSLHGNPNLLTPNIDSLARQGAEVEHFYVCAVCSPTRAEFLTGRYHTRSGVYSTSRGGERFDADERTIADLFQAAGYATAAYGKWHSGMQYPYHPNARGFEDFYGFCSGHWGNYFSPMLEHNGRIVEGEGYLVDDLTDHAIRFIEEHRGDPFFVYLPFNTPHSPMQVPDRDWHKFAEKEIVPDPRPENAKRQDLQHTRAALAMCENIDGNVGRLLERLDQLELAEETIVVYFCDNGPNGWRFNGGLRGRKGSTFEGGVRSPCIVRWPARIPSGTRVKQIGGAIDLMPTLAEMCGVPVSDTKPLDGQSLAVHLTGGGQLQDRLIFTAWNRKASVRDQRFRLHHTGQLFDIAADPGEQHDVAGRHPEQARKLRAALNQWLAETDPKRKQAATDRPFTLGHPEAQYTQLPARDAVPHGGIERSNRFPNCTFMTNWKSTDDRITWDVEVLGTGEHEVQMYYACPRESVGTELQLELGDASLSATIKEPNEVPLIGAERDRYERMEGYVKDWKSMTLGTIQLRPGRHTLTLRATQIAGEDVGDMRLLIFRKL